MWGRCVGHGTGTSCQLTPFNEFQPSVSISWIKKKILEVTSALRRGVEQATEDELCILTVTSIRFGLATIQLLIFRFKKKSAKY